MRLLELYEIKESSDELYHVTLSKHVPNIQRAGLRPMGGPSNWIQQGSGERYGMGEIYVFTNKQDAKRWAGRMDWEFNQTIGSGNISIITLRRPEGHDFVRDESDPMSQAGAQGEWLKTYEPIPAQNIIAAQVFRSMKEAKQSTVGIIFGRFNPPHKGHKAAWEMASENDNWYVGTNQSTQGPKDPLPYDVKIEAMKAVMPEVEGHIVPSQSWLTLASEVYKKHGGGILRIYTDEAWVINVLKKYNGVSSEHGMYKFKDIVPVATPRLSSATAVRQAVADNNKVAFQDAAGVSPNTKVAGKPFFNVVKKYLDQYQK